MAELSFVTVQIVHGPLLGLLQEPVVAEKWLHAIWARGCWMKLPPVVVVLGSPEC